MDGGHPHPVDTSYLVVIGASAGGVEALERFVASLPEDFAAPIVIAQHSDPKGPGRFAEILRRQARLPIHIVSEDDDELKPRNVYIAAPGRNLAVKGSRLLSVARERGKPIPSIDLLFTSAAESNGDGVIAVILTGMGTDGVAGVRAVKEHGGTVVVQELGDAAYPALPAAIPQHYIDFASNIESLTSLLVTLVNRTDGLVASDPEGLRAFLTQIRSRSGIDFRQYKEPTIRRRLARLMAAARTETLAEYLRYLRTHEEAYQQLISSFLIKVTGFFRDGPLFNYLRESIFPDIIAEAREKQHELRIWSAGCATGEEAYSLAILLAELLGDALDEVRIRIFATDLDIQAIAFARRGLYPASAFTDIAPEMVAKYFTAVNGAYQVKKHIRNLTVFGEYDLGQRAPFPHIDLILCRNVLIYFTKELQQRVLQLFAFSLRVGGYLVLGKAETTSPLPQFFAPAQPTLKVYRRHGERLLIPAPLVDGLTLPERPTVRRPALRPTTPSRRLQEDRTTRWALVDRLGSFVFDSSIGIVMVDANYDIQTINQAARVLLGIPGQGIGSDLVHISALAPAELKAALDAAFRGDEPVELREFEVGDSASGEKRYVELACYPDRSSGKEGRVEGVIVVLIDVTKDSGQRRLLQAELERSRSSVQQLTLQNKDLIERQRSLMQANTEVNEANSDLRNSNEHLMIAAEEAEASAEEVETLNEELQATSEELETLNEELQATVEELNTTNEELGARSSELERTVRDHQTQLDSAYASLSTLRQAVEHLPIVLCLLDRNLKVLSTSRSYQEVAERNRGLMPLVGEQWRKLPKRLSATIDDGETEEFAVRPIGLPNNNGEQILLLEAEGTERPSKS
jgi:two-component system, chemotaxis family, CheB/CheR fusion protein